MPLPEDYLIYPHRSYGMDHPYLDWAPLPGRKPTRLENGTKVAVTLIVPIEFFPLNPPREPFLHPGAMKTPYPDLRHYTVRDYGNRVGVYRLLRAFSTHGIEATFAVNAAVANRYPPLLDAIRKAGHEIAAHGVSTAHIHYGDLARDEEARWVQQARDTFPDAVTWLSPARHESLETLDILAEAGFRICLDWEADIVPVTFETKAGPLRMLSNYGELGDMKLLNDRSQTEDDWRTQIIEAVTYSLDRYDREGSSALGLTLTPYIVGQPFRVAAVRDLLETLTGLEGVRILSARQSIALFDATPAAAS